MPLFQKKKVIWQIKELEGYLNKVDSQVPPNYDVKSCDSVHQTLDAIIRSNWDSLHPIEQDFICSWFIEYQTVEEQKNDLKMQLEAINKEIITTQKNSESKIGELNKQIQNLSNEILNSKNILIQKNQFIDDLTKAIRDQEHGREELKQKLEERMKNMNTEMLDRQKKFEASQIEIGTQFKTKVMDLDEEKLLLNEKIQKNNQKLNQLENENQNLRQRYHSLKRFQKKLSDIKSKIAEIPLNLVEGKG